MNYRKKPVVIEAYQFAVEMTPEWAAEAYVNGVLWDTADNEAGIELHIETLEGEMVAEQGDFIIKGVHGEIYSCKPDIFEETYEEVK
jgi:hypothetical protein